jgi:hypothetical protein
MSRKRNTTTKEWFIGGAVFTAILTVAFGLGLVLLRSTCDKISIFNLWIDMVVGFFTIWGLGWAASEFAESAVRPSLKLLPGKMVKPYLAGWEGLQDLDHSLIETPPFVVDGWTQIRQAGGRPPSRAPTMACALFLDNEKSRAGRYVQVVAHVLSTPAPRSCWFRHHGFQAGESKVDGAPNTNTGHWTLPLRFSEGLVVYQSPVFVGDLFLQWDKAIPDDQLPEEVVLQYETHALDGSSVGRLELCISEWSGIT